MTKHNFNSTAVIKNSKSLYATNIYYKIKRKNSKSCWSKSKITSPIRSN